MYSMMCIWHRCCVCSHIQLLSTVHYLLVNIFHLSFQFLSILPRWSSELSVCTVFNLLPHVLLTTYNTMDLLFSLLTPACLFTIKEQQTQSNSLTVNSLQFKILLHLRSQLESGPQMQLQHFDVIQTTEQCPQLTGESHSEL